MASSVLQSAAVEAKGELEAAIVCLKTKAVSAAAAAAAAVQCWKAADQPVVAQDASFGVMVNTTE